MQRTRILNIAIVVVILLMVGIGVTLMLNVSEIAGWQRGPFTQYPMMGRSFGFGHRMAGGFWGPALLLLGGLVLFRVWSHRDRPHIGDTTRTEATHDAAEILRRRFAEGEISAAELRERLAVLSETEDAGGNQ